MIVAPTSEPQLNAFFYESHLAMVSLAWRFREVIV